MGISMGLSKRVYIALFAVLAELVVIAATGNQGVTNFVRDNMATSPLGDQFLKSIPSFPWRYSVESGTGGSTILIAQYSAIAALLVLTFLLVLIAVRGNGGFSGPFFGTILAVVGSSIVAQMVGNVVAYDYVGRQAHTGLGRVGYSLFDSNDGLTIMFALMCGVVVALVAGIVGWVIRRRLVAKAALAAAEADAAAARARGDQAMVNEFFGPAGAGGAALQPVPVSTEPAPWGSYDAQPYEPQAYQPQAYAPQPADPQAADPHTYAPPAAPVAYGAGESGAGESAAYGGFGSEPAAPETATVEPAAAAGYGAPTQEAATQAEATAREVHADVPAEAHAEAPTEAQVEAPAEAHAEVPAETEPEASAHEAQAETVHVTQSIPNE